MNWEAVIGIEVHVELSTRSKMFCGCAVSFGEEPNTNVCPTCLGLPGALPVPNRAAIESIIGIGLALGCRVSPQSVFHRKNYFYADLPKNYQISQFDNPVCVDGHLDIDVDGETIRIGIERAHMEEDTGKSTHLGDGGRIHSARATRLDFNRSGVPLVEIVSRPDLRSAAQARVYAQELRSVVAELGVSDAKLEEGSIRFDANVSIRREGDVNLGTKVEIKNMNSFRSLERAVEFEMARQIDLVETGGHVIQETRHWEEESEVTHPMRTKEGSSDYRYFTEPDLVPMVMDDDLVDQIRSDIPELPAQRRARFAAQGLDQAAAEVLSGSSPHLRHIYESAVQAGAPARSVANWVVGDLTAAARRSDDEDLPFSGKDLAELISLVDTGRVSSSAAKDVLEGVLAGEGPPTRVAEERDLIQISDHSELETAVEDVIAANPQAVSDYRAGESKIVGFLVGQVMKATQGKADPKAVNEMIRHRLDG